MCMEWSVQQGQLSTFKGNPIKRCIHHHQCFLNSRPTKPNRYLKHTALTHGGDHTHRVTDTRPTMAVPNILSYPANPWLLTSPSASLSFHCCNHRSYYSNTSNDFIINNAKHYFNVVSCLPLPKVATAAKPKLSCFTSRMPGKFGVK